MPLHRQMLCCPIYQNSNPACLLKVCLFQAHVKVTSTLHIDHFGIRRNEGSNVQAVLQGAIGFLSSVPTLPQPDTKGPSPKLGHLQPLTALGEGLLGDFSRKLPRVIHVRRPHISVQYVRLSIQNMQLFAIGS